MGVICVAAGTLWTFVSGGGFGAALVGLKVFPIVIIGGGFGTVASWLVLVAVLVLRPHGLFGTARVERV